MTLQEHLARKGWPKILITLHDVGNRQLSNMRSQQTIGRTPAGAVAKARGAIGNKYPGQTVRLTPRDAH